MYEVFHNTSYIYITANILHIHKMHIYIERERETLMRCAICYQSLFGVCMAVRTRTNVWQRMACYGISMAFERVYQMTNV